MTVATIPSGCGFVTTLRATRADITGLAHQDIDLSVKRLELLQRAVPGLKRVAVIWNGLEGKMQANEIIRSSPEG